MYLCNLLMTFVDVYVVMDGSGEDPRRAAFMAWAPGEHRTNHRREVLDKSMLLP